MRTGNLNRIGRVFVASLALLANLVAVGVPVLHASAHERHAHAHDKDHPDAAESTRVSTEVEHPHDEVHPAALHEDGLVLPRTSVDFGGVVQPDPVATLFVVISSERSLVPDGILLSRAPPGDAAARAPPLQ